MTVACLPNGSHPRAEPGISWHPQGHSFLCVCLFLQPLLIQSNSCPEEVSPTASEWQKAKKVSGLLGGTDQTQSHPGPSHHASQWFLAIFLRGGGRCVTDPHHIPDPHPLNDKPACINRTPRKIPARY